MYGRLCMVAAFVAAVSMAGCQETERADVNLVPPDEKNAFSLLLGDEIGLVDYAQLKVRNQCLADEGFPQNLGIMLDKPRHAFPHLTISAATFGPTSENEARRIGFGRDQEAKPGSVVSFDPNYDRAFDKCTQRAWDRLGSDAEGVYRGYFDLVNKLGGPLMTMIDERLSDDVPAKLMVCITGKGYRVPDPDGFLRQPNPRELGVPVGSFNDDEAAEWKPTQVAGTVQVRPAAPARRYQAGPDEGALAVAWLQCRQATGLIAQQLAIATEVQRELITKHEDALVELNPRVQRLARQAAALVGSS